MVKNTAAADPLIGRKLGKRYELVALVARGGMATVYRAHDRQLDRVVAVKVPRPEFAQDRRFSAQFRREARAAARLGHPNVVAVYDSGEERGVPFIVMEFASGRTLRQVLDAAERLDPQTTAELIGSVAAALDHAHASGVVHLDVKPENVLLTADTVKVADFGLVRAMRGAAEHAPAGTVQYVAPEVLRGDRVDGRADVYALGVVAYECLTGRPPFDGPDREQVAQQHLNERILPPSRVVPGIPPAADRAVLLATEPDPDRRYHRPGDFAHDLGAPRRRPLDAAFGATPTTATFTAAPAPGSGTVAGGGHPSEMPTVNHAAVPGATATTRHPAVHVPDGYGEPPRPRRRRVGPPRVLVVPALLVLLVGGMLGWVFLNPSPTTVPDVTGMPPAVARARLLAAGLRVTTGAPVPSLEVREGQVAEQDPPAGQESTRRAAVELRLSSGVPLADLPDLTGQQQDAAVQRLQSLGLEPAVEGEISEEVDRGTVLRTEPPGPTQIPQGDTVTLFVSDGPPRVRIPEVRGQPEGVAQTLLRSAGLEVDSERVFDDEVPEGFATGTDPGGGEEIAIGAEITMGVSRGPEPVEVPDLEGLTLEEAERILEELGLEVNLPFGDQFALRFNDEVADQDPRAGREVPPGTPVTLRFNIFN